LGVYLWFRRGYFTTPISSDGTVYYEETRFLLLYPLHHERRACDRLGVVAEDSHHPYAGDRNAARYAVSIVRAAAAGKVTVTSLEEARGDAIPLSEAMGPDGPKGAAVFALLLPSPLGDRVHYVGVAKDAGNALASAASSTGIDPDDLKDVTVAWADLPKTARKPALQAAWKAWLGAVGYAPEGNTAVAASTPAEKDPE
jgi:hypothetical protein